MKAKQLINSFTAFCEFDTHTEAQSQSQQAHHSFATFMSVSCASP